MSAGASNDATLLDMHKTQLLVLEQAVAEERAEDARINQLCQTTLRTKYDHFVESLLNKAKLEGEMYMERALNHLETDVQHETLKLRERVEMQQAIEDAATSKLQGIISELRKSWEDEEVARAKRLEDRLRSHYSVILEHMEAQLQMALQLQDEVDKQWVKDVEMRNRQQTTLMSAFENKCRRLYDTRLTEYIERTDQQMTEYTTQLLQVGGAIAQERSRVESHKRRLKMACFQWKVDFQADVQKRYQKMVDSLESKYMAEIERLLERQADLVMQRSNGGDSDNENSTSISCPKMVAGLAKQFEEASVPAATQVQILMSLLEKASTNHQMGSNYDFVRQKMTSRITIQQKVERKNFLVYKLDLIKKKTSGSTKTGGGVALTMQQKLENHDIVKELAEIQVQLDEMYKKYDSFYGEPYHLTTAQHQHQNQPVIKSPGTAEAQRKFSPSANQGGKGVPRSR